MGIGGLLTRNRPTALHQKSKDIIIYQIIRNISPLLLVFTLSTPVFAFGNVGDTPGQIYISIMDNTDNLSASIIDGYSSSYFIPEPNPATVIGFNPWTTSGILVNEVLGSLANSGAQGAFEAHFNYLSSMAFQSGQTLFSNFNIYGPGAH